jgi:alkanesulfonate monooxygenase SsuD/methylene tetrahydromethanopterin reductase-like flavin-dependent oxidoreductase (luciferase family)
MHFDLFCELALPSRHALTEGQVYADTLTAIELGDRTGFHCAWLTEHHFLRGYSHSSKPELTLAAAAQRTRRIRLGHAVIPLPLHHPVHVAERVATLDILSGGRLEIGIGRGFSPREFEVFGARMEASRELAQEGLDILRASFAPGPVTFHGKHYSLDALDILPHAVQRPHPPLWTAAVSPETYTWAAAQGLGVLSGPFKPWFMVRHDLGNYRAAWRSSRPRRIGMTLGVLCLKDGKRARAIAHPAFTWFYRELYKTTLPVLERLYPSYEQIHELGRFRQLMKLGIDFGLADAFGLAVVGTPEECIAKLAKYADAGVTHVLCAFGAGAVEHSVVQESMELFAREVIPAFAKDGA